MTFFHELDEPPGQCLGFCARTAIRVNASYQTWSNCGPCEWGYRSAHKLTCELCNSPLSIYDWLYLLFVAIIPLLIHSFYIHFHTPARVSRIHQVAEHFCCIIECALSAALSVLLFRPRWTLRLEGCQSNAMREWYPNFYNPLVNYVKRMRCTYEVVYPLYSLPFVYLLLLSISILILRPLLYHFILRRHRDAKPFFYALITIPKIAFWHFVGAGVLYHFYPYLVMLYSIGANAVHLSLEQKKSIRELFVSIRSSPKHIMILTIHMALFAFSLVAMSAIKETWYGLFSLVLVPIPPLFYIATVGLSHPQVIYHL